MADRFNALPFTQQLERVLNNPEILQAKVIFEFKNIPKEIDEELQQEGKSLKPFTLSK